MPLGRNVGANIEELRLHGSRPRTEGQILAIALSGAREAGARIKAPPGKRVVHGHLAKALAGRKRA